VLGLEPFFFVFRLIHILAGVAWAGGVFTFVVFVQPSAAAVGPAAGPMMGQLLGARKLVDRFLLLAGIAIAAGLVMYVKLWNDAGSFGDWIGSRYGLAITIGTVTALAAASIGMFGTRPNVRALMALQRRIAEGGEPPTPEQGAEIARRQATLKVLGRIALGLLVVTVTTMATASAW
jgi:uncharacterized membrane protein